MKKIVLLSAAIFTSVLTAYSYPGVDVNPAGMPLQIIQQQTFQKNDYYDYRRFTDAFDNPVEKRNESPEEIQAEFEEIQNLKQPPKIELGTSKKKPDMELIQDDGHIKIKHTEN